MELVASKWRYLGTHPFTLVHSSPFSVVHVYTAHIVMHNYIVMSTIGVYTCPILFIPGFQEWFCLSPAAPTGCTHMSVWWGSPEVRRTCTDWLWTLFIRSRSSSNLPLLARLHDVSHSYSWHVNYMLCQFFLEFAKSSDPLSHACTVCPIPRTWSTSLEIQIARP